VQLNHDIGSLGLKTRGLSIPVKSRGARLISEKYLSNVAYASEGKMGLQMCECPLSNPVFSRHETTRQLNFWKVDAFQWMRLKGDSLMTLSVDKSVVVLDDPRQPEVHCSSIQAAPGVQYITLVRRHKGGSSRCQAMVRLVFTLPHCKSSCFTPL